MSEPLASLKDPIAGAPDGYPALHHAERVCLSVTALIAIMILFAWLFPAFASLLPHGWDLMKVNTAIGMLLATAGLWMADTTSSSGTSASRVLAAALSLLSALILLEHLAGIRLRMDTWLAADAVSPNPGLTSAHTAIGLLLLGLVTPFSIQREGTLSKVADALVFALVGFLLVLLSGYIYGAARLVGESSLILVSPQTAACFALLGFVAVTRRVVFGGFSSLLKQRKVARVVLISAPLIIALIYITGFFYIYVRQHDYLTRVDGVALSVSALSMVVLYVILLMATHINRLEQNVRGLLQKRSDEQLRESEQRYTEVVEQAISGFVIRRPDGHLILVNEAYRKMTGYSREELLKLKARDLVVDQGVIERTQRLKSGESAHIETFLKRKDGSLLEVEYVTQRLKNGNFQSFLLDISYRKNIQKARDESERRYAELVDQALEGIMVRRPNGDILFANETFCRMLDYSREELLKFNIRDIVHPDDAETIQQIQQLGHGGRLHLHKRMRRKDGGVIYVEVSAKRLRNGDIQTTVQDVTERKHAETRFRAMVEGAPNAMIMVDGGGLIALANPQAESLFGYGPGELVGCSVETLVPARFRTGHPARRAGFAGENRARSMGAGRDLYGLRKDGSEVPVEIGLNPILTGDGRFVLASIIDITERKRLEQAQRESEQRYQDLVEQAADAIWLRRQDGQMVFVNDAGCKLLGYTREELLKSGSAQLIHDSDPDTSRWMDALKPLETLRIERVMRHKDGHAIPVEASCHRLADDSMQIISHDITERKRSAEELRQMSRRLSEAQETERRAIARELHDEVGQSLTATRINLRDLEQQVEGGPLAQRLTDTAAIIADLLSKVRQMSLDLHPSVLDDLGVVAALRWCVRTRVTGNSLEVVFDLPEDLPRFDDMAEITLFRVFQEALSNVLRHAQARHLHVTLRHAQHRLDLTMKDDGVGFDAQAARRHAMSGKSLGLLGMQERARLAGGDIVLESAAGRGTELQLSLPATER